MLAETARAMAFAAPEGLKGLRDRALLLLGFSGTFRRPELVALNVGDLEETEDGFRITIRHSKTDQEGRGQVIAVCRGGASCPVKAVKAWLAESGILEGAIFRPVAKGGRLGESRLTAKADDTTKFPCPVKGILGGAGPCYAWRGHLSLVWGSVSGFCRLQLQLPIFAILGGRRLSPRRRPAFPVTTIIAAIRIFV